MAVGVLALCPSARAADETLFSGPQPDEPLPALKVELVLADDPGASVDLAAKNPERPHLMVVFVHQTTRPSVAFARELGEYAATRKDDGLRTGIVFLGEDATELAERVRRARHALPSDVTIGISPEGIEGPGAYGLNRNATLTILVASKGIVRANHVLVDPSIPVELPKVLESICEVAGGEPPSLESLLERGPRMRRRESQLRPGVEDTDNRGSQ